MTQFALTFAAGVASTLVGLVVHEGYKSWRKRRRSHRYY